jgi:hypothetical protein
MSEVTVIQVVKGDDNSGTRRPLNQTQRAGRACVVCQGTEDLSRHVGWVDGVSIRVHSYHLENYRLGETLPPPAA